MAFHWRDHDERPLQDRFDPETLGYPTWRRFLDALLGPNRPEMYRALAPDEWRLAIFANFLNALDADVPQSAAAKMRSDPIVFVSHQRSDVAEAERIAHLARNHGIDYWLDVHDPVLRLANRTIPKEDLLYPIIIAAIIEMALLNSTHLIAVHSVNSMNSKWVPYELGRIRDRHIWSLNTGGWFHPRIDPRQCGDYVHLSLITLGGEYVVTSWLQNWARGRHLAPLDWPPGKPTTPLPDRR